MSDSNCNSDCIVEPLGDIGSRVELSVACKCGAGSHPTDAERCAAGHVRLGNQRAMVVGARSMAFWATQKVAREAIRAAVIRDAGHAVDDAPEALQLAADGIAQASLVRDSAFDRLVASGGPLTDGGRPRRAFTVWLQAADRLERHLRLVGLSRRPRAGLSFLDSLRRGANAGQDPDDTTDTLSG